MSKHSDSEIDYFLFFPSSRRKDKIYHYRISNDDDSFSIFPSDGFASVPELIEHYKGHPKDFIDENGEAVYLSEPLVLETSHPPLQQEK